MNDFFKNIPYKKVGINPDGLTPVLEPVVLKPSKEIGLRKRPAVIICPGGGYKFLSDRETEPVAMRFASFGINSFILRYSTSVRFPAALMELASAVRYVRENAEQFDIDPDKILVCGFSAGGHLAASLGTLWNSEYLKNILGNTDICRPDGMILSYPVITTGKYRHQGSVDSILGEKPSEEMLKLVSLENQADDKTPKTFIWHCADDKNVPVENTLDFVKALSCHNISFECHIFPQGGHGLALSDESTAGRESHINPVCAQWAELALNWVKREFMNR
ncbi:alpha/beta hydrolase [Porcipelethomonas sp.]|uniref:alpha/beta hydrolase n=1 Tax=Porcipelethomonas sp. TaxID=2981675 RepID=UPI003EF53FC0